MNLPEVSHLPIFAFSELIQIVHHLADCFESSCFSGIFFNNTQIIGLFFLFGCTFLGPAGFTLFFLDLTGL